jgi:glycosyltransferase involved in cell wall biosynthesis
LVLVGLDEDYDSQYLKVFAKKKLGDKKIRIFGLQPIQDVPEFLSIADIVAIPQKRNFATAVQIPAKVFNAMAMAKPTIATSVSDLPEILKNCGWIVEPEKPEQLAKAIQYIFDHPEEAKVMGWRARQKCIAEYSYTAIEKVLVSIFSKYESQLK